MNSKRKYLVTLGAAFGMAIVAAAPANLFESAGNLTTANVVEVAASAPIAQTTAEPPTITHINPDGLYKSPAYSQAVLVEGGKTLYIGGQNGILPDGTLVGDTLGTQTEQAYKNILEILTTVGASQENVVKLTIYVVTGQDIEEGFAAAQNVWGDFPTAISFIFVESLGVPGALVEIEGIAVVGG
jgi:2-iminobutanoate/2-iminopropanoate deaminase